MSASLKRITKEFSLLITNPSPGISAGPTVDDMYHWDAYITGPENTPYEGGLFHLSVEFPDQYPFKPPKVQFVTKILHCNIDRYGCVNLDILRDCWSPALTVGKVLLSVQMLLTDPNPDDPLVPELGSLLKRDPKAYNQRVKEATLLYAT